MALTTDTSVLTRAANDCLRAGLRRQIEALGQPGDVAFGISTGCRSVNVEAALQTARSRGLRTIAMTERGGGRAGQVAEIHVNVPGETAPRVQEVHRTPLHVLCELVETAYA